MNDRIRATLIKKSRRSPGHPLEIARLRSECRTCFSRTWCCDHAEHEKNSATTVDSIICVCKGPCKNMAAIRAKGMGGLVA